MRIAWAGSAGRTSSSSTGSLANTVVCRLAAPVVSVTPGVCSVSHTVHDDIPMLSAPRMLVGAPTMPTIGPRGSGLRNLSSTSFGLSFLPTISRAEARLSTGCTLSPIRTNAAPLDLLSRICASPRFGDGLKKASTPHGAGDEHRDHHANDQRPHLATHWVVDHPRVAADQRMLESPDQKPVAVYLRARGNLRWHGRSHHSRVEACTVGYSTYSKRGAPVDLHSEQDLERAPGPTPPVGGRFGDPPRNPSAKNRRRHRRTAVHPARRFARARGHRRGRQSWSRCTWTCPAGRAALPVWLLRCCW